MDRMLKECEEKIAVLGERVAERDKELRLQGVELIDELQKRISLYEEEMGQLKAQAAITKGSLETTLKEKARAESEEDSRSSLSRGRAFQARTTKIVLAAGWLTCKIVIVWTVAPRQLAGAPCPAGGGIALWLDYSQH